MSSGMDQMAELKAAFERLEERNAAKGEGRRRSMSAPEKLSRAPVKSVGPPLYFTDSEEEDAVSGEESSLR